ncbi:hypothetical protein F4806DRAFT_506537 [Annulohypoxylon nitens]|nr:hypothetical protein F4806DRAFT_506537 [Annulohypoxylon nitens]
MEAPIPRELPSGEQPPSFNRSIEKRFAIIQPVISSQKDLGQLEIGGPDYNDKYTSKELMDIAYHAKENPRKDPYPEWSNITPEVIFQAKNHKDATEYAHEALPGKRLIMYADGSVKRIKGAHPSCVGIGIAYKYLNIPITGVARNEWIGASYGVDGVTNTTAVETLSLHRSLCISRYSMEKIAQDSSVQGPLRVIIFCDCFGAIAQLRSFYHWKSTGCTYTLRRRKWFRNFSEEVFDEMHNCIRRLVLLGATVEFNWLPGHVGIDGNTRSDALARIGGNYMYGFRKTHTGSPYGLYPAQAKNSRRARKIISDIHRGRPSVDLVYWIKSKTIDMINKTYNAIEGHDKGKRKAESLEEDDGNIVALMPLKKKPKTCKKGFTDKQVDT